MVRETSTQANHDCQARLDQQHCFQHDWTAEKLTFICTT